MPAQHTEKPHWLNIVDPRLKIILAGCFGVATWHVTPTVLGCYTFCLWLLCAQADFFSRTHWPILRSYLLFVLFWTGMKFTLDCTSLLEASSMQTAAFMRQAGIEAGLLGLRLCILIGLGLILALTTSPRQLGLALSWFLRPILGQHSWKTALSLALMIHFLPLTQATFTQVKQSILLRQPKRSRWECFLLVPQATLRILAQKTWTQTIAIAARGLDTPEAWIPHFPPQPLGWIVGVFLATAGLLPLFLW